MRKLIESVLNSRMKFVEVSRLSLANLSVKQKQIEARKCATLHIYITIIKPFALGIYHSLYRKMLIHFELRLLL